MSWGVHAVGRILGFASVVGCGQVSREPPAFFEKGDHNLVDAPDKRTYFGNASRWTADMEWELRPAPEHVLSKNLQEINIGNRYWVAFGVAYGGAMGHRTDHTRVWK